MIRAFRSDLLKLRRPRVLYGTLAALFGFTVLVTVLSVGTATDHPAGRGVATAALTATTGATVGFANSARLVGLVIVVLFLTAVTTEYSLGTIRTLLTRQPRRPLLLLGKFAALLLSTATALLAALVLSVAAATTTMRSRGLPVAAWFTGDGVWDIGASYVDALVAGLAYGALGLALGVLVRGTVAAVGVALVWFFMAENIAANLWADADRWFPGLLAGAAMAGETRGLAGAPIVAAVALAVAVAVFTRRDVRT
ncbi:ABC transporter permease [Dactylosporangium sp. NPDC051541]|uniref:ABC transporter permease n=1 Tax=Dactylosporangium sp. NPDC051541 TaxID=3363977 RepID=UPI00379866FA